MIYLSNFSVDGKNHTVDLSRQLCDREPRGLAMISTTRRKLLVAAVPAFASVIWPSQGAHAASKVTSNERKRIDNLIEKFMRDFEVPGLSMCIAFRGNVVLESGYGLSDRKAKEETQTSTLFRIASLSKPITSVAVFTLLEAGKLKLSDRVFGEEGLLGTKHGKRPYNDDLHLITVDHLLTHTAGGWGNDGSDPMFSDVSASLDELISATLDIRPLDYKPGTRYAYSNFGYCLLGRVIEAVSGASYEAYVRDAVLQLCGVTRMRIAGNTRNDRADGEAVYYGQDDFNQYSMNVRRMDSHGGWLASSGDLVRFLLHVDGFKSVKDILEPASIKIMTKPSSVEKTYARGWAVNRHNNWWHTGSLPGTTAFMARTSSGFCWAALINTRRSNSEMDRKLDELMWEVSEVPSAWRN